MVGGPAPSGLPRRAVGGNATQAARLAELQARQAQAPGDVVDARDGALGTAGGEAPQNRD